MFFLISKQKPHVRSLTCRHVQEGLKALVPQANTRFLCKISTRTKFWQSSCKRKDNPNMSRYLNTFHIADPLWGESTSHWWIPHTEGQLCRTLMITVVSTNKQSIKWPVIWNAIAQMWHNCNGCRYRYVLTHWGWDKMTAILQATHSNGFSLIKLLELQLRFHWSLFLRVQLTISQHCFR